MEGTADVLLLPLEYDLRVAAHPASHAFPTFPRSSKHDQRIPSRRRIKRHAAATEHILQTLSKFDHARVFLTGHDHIETNAGVFDQTVPT
jgi:hypothetical protein